MVTHRKVFRFRMRPTGAQEPLLGRLAGARRWVFNWGLQRKREHYAETGKALTYNVLAELAAIKTGPGTAWLREVDSQSLQQALKDLDRAFRNFFEKRARFPRFKSRKRSPAGFRIPQRVKVEGHKVYVPKVGWVRIRLSQPVDLATKSATFQRDALGHWYVTLAAEFEMPDVALPMPQPAQVVGIDLRLIDFATITDAPPVPAPKFFRKGQKKQRRAQRALRRRRPGSTRQVKARRAVAEVHRKIKNQRNDFLHKLSTDLVDRHEGICIEDLCLRGLARTKRTSKSFSDAALGEFSRQLEYKCFWQRKHLIKVVRFYPSSKRCHGCGAINEALTLKDREWDCQVCGAHHHRDCNAAENIKDEGLRILAAGQAGEAKRSGSRCKTPLGAVGVEPRIPRL